MSYVNTPNRATLFSSFAAEKESHVATVESEVTTKGTAFDGTRDSKTSEWSKFTVPAGFVFDKESVKKRYQSRAVSTNRIDVEWADYVELIPGTKIFWPRTIRVRTHARSAKSNYPGHNAGARGWTKATVTARYVRFN